MKFGANFGKIKFSQLNMKNVIATIIIERNERVLSRQSHWQLCHVTSHELSRQFLLLAVSNFIYPVTILLLMKDVWI